MPDVVVRWHVRRLGHVVVPLMKSRPHALQPLEVPQGWMIRRTPSPDKQHPRIAHLLLFCQTDRGLVETSACNYGPYGYPAIDYRPVEPGDRKCTYCLKLETP